MLVYVANNLYHHVSEARQDDQDIYRALYDLFISDTRENSRYEQDKLWTDHFVSQLLFDVIDLQNWPLVEAWVNRGAISPASISQTLSVTL